MSQTLDTRALSMLEARIIEEINREGESLLKGAASEFSDYRFRVGRVAGLEKVRDLMEEVERDLYHGGTAKKS